MNITITSKGVEPNYKKDNIKVKLATHDDVSKLARLSEWLNNNRECVKTVTGTLTIKLNKEEAYDALEEVLQNINIQK